MPIYEGATVEAAIAQGLAQLALEKDQVTVNVLAEGKKGFLGMGKKVARVQIEPLPVVAAAISPTETTEADTIQSAEVSVEMSDTLLSDEAVLDQLATYLMAISQALTAPATIEFTKAGDQTIVHLQTAKQGLLIGKHGKTLNALQYLAQVFVHRLTRSKLTIVLNVGDYREKRQDILQRLAQRTAEKVERTNRPVFLEPMPAFERKQIHAALSKNQAIQTHSEGEEPYRYLVVEPTKNRY